MFRLFKRKDPICNMKEERGKGIEFDGRWFCSQDCRVKYEKKKNQPVKPSCCP